MTSARRRTIVESFIVLTLALSVVFLLKPGFSWLREGVIYVSPDGHDIYLGQSTQWAVKTIQRAADIASPGEAVVILPGTYREEVRVRRGGTADQPITFRAHEPGTVTITGAAEAETLRQLTWREEGGGIRSATPPWPVHYLRWSETNLFHVAWGGLKRLRMLTALPGAMPAFAYDRDSNRLYVFLPADAWPADPKFLTHRPVPSPREWGNIRSANMWIETDHVILEGLRFDFGIGAGLLLWNASRATVKDCLFTGADVGIGASPRVGGSQHISVEHSAYHNFPQYHWQKSWLPWREVYASHSSSSLIAMDGRHVTIRNNIVSNGGDSVRITPVSGEGRWGAVVKENLFFRGTDDAIEAEGEVHGVHIVGNIVYDHHQNLGLSPVWTGPVLVEQNLFLHPHGGLNGSQIKLLNGNVPSGMHKPPPIRNIAVKNNVFVGRWLAWSDKPVVEVSVSNNVFALQQPVEPGWPLGLQAQDNTMIKLPETGYPDPSQDQQWWTLPGASTATRIARPGPRWLNWDESPATRELAALFSRAGWPSAPQMSQ